jgi:chemotaxis protein MotB
MARPPEDPSGIMVYPKMPVPSQRQSEPRVKGFGTSSGGGGGKKKTIAMVGGAAVVGGLIGFLVRPTHGGEADKAKEELANVQKTSQAKVDDLNKQVAKLTDDKAAVDKQVADLSTKSADVDKKAAELEAEEKKIRGAIDSSSGSVTTEGNEIHLQLVDKVLFPVGDDQLTDKGKQVLDKVAVALKEIPNKAIWVQGHTDDQPIYVKPQKPPPKKGAKPEPKEKLPEALRYMTNWELSAARALEVVHYLQDTAKIDPSRLAALAFGQYHPISRGNKAANRRIEIVLVPRKEVLQKETAAPKK